VFFLDLREIRSAADLRALVTTHRAAYDQEVRRPRVPRFVQSDGVEH
jgi:hypothetical protein